MLQDVADDIAAFFDSQEFTALTAGWEVLKNEISGASDESDRLLSINERMSEIRADEHGLVPLHERINELRQEEVKQGGILLTISETMLTAITSATILYELVNGLLKAAVWNAASLWEQLKLISSILADRLMGLLWQMGIILGVMWERMKNVASDVWDSIVGVANDALTVIQDSLQVLVDSWTETKKAAIRTWDFISTEVMFIVEALANHIKFMIGTAWEAIKIVATLVWDAIKATANTTIDIVSATVAGLEVVWDGVSAAAVSSFNWLQDNSSAILDAVTASIGAITSGWNDMKTAVENVFNFINSNMPDLSGFTNFFEGAAGFIGGGLSALDPRGRGAGARAMGSFPAAKKSGGGLQRFSGNFSSLPGVSAASAKGGFRFRSRDSGGRGGRGQPVLIGAGAQPEAFIPDSAGTFIPNADKMGGNSITVNGVTIMANSEAEGRAAAQGFTDELSRFATQQGFSIAGLTG